jgi:sugar phosphate isomerase/epimerase
MNVGWCAGIERSEQVRAVGFDFLEMALGPMNLENDDAFDKAKAAVARAPLPMPVFSRLLPLSMRIVGPDADRSRIRRYMARLAEVADAAGTDIVVLGAGWARSVPAGWSRDRAREQFVETVTWCAEALNDSGTVVALEAPNHAETNLVTTIAEAVDVARLVNRFNVRVIADLYHLYVEPEPFDVVTELADWIVHVHLSDIDRKPPGPDSYDVGPLFDRLKASGYDGRLSIECMSDIPEPEMRRALDFVRQRWAE